MAERRQDLGTYAYAKDLSAVAESGALDLLTLDYLVEAGACVLGTPTDCVEACRQYEEAGVDTLLCLVNPLQDSARGGPRDHRVDGPRGDSTVPLTPARSTGGDRRSFAP